MSNISVLLKVINTIPVLVTGLKELKSVLPNANKKTEALINELIEFNTAVSETLQQQDQEIKKLKVINIIQFILILCLAVYVISTT